MNQKRITKHLTKDTFTTFKKVRDLSTPLYGNYQLYSKSGLKYLCKHFPKNLTFFTYRNPTSHILLYQTADHSIYLFPLLGDQIFNFAGKSTKDSHESELKLWVQKCGSVENCLWEIFRLLIKLIEEKNLTEVLLECLRVHNGELQYCFDTWMKPTSQIVLENPCELQNYYFSPWDLQFLKETLNQSTDIKPTKKSLYFRVCLLIIDLGISGLSERHYQYGQFLLHREHLKMKLNQFCSKYKNIGGLLKKILEDEQYSTEEIWLSCQSDLKEKRNIKSNSILSSVRTMKKSGSTLKKNKENDERSSLTSQKVKINASFVSDVAGKDEEQDSYLMLQKSGLSMKKSHLELRDEKSQNKPSITLKKNLSNTKWATDEKRKSKCKAIDKEQSKTYKLWQDQKIFNFKQILLQIQDLPRNCTTLLKYLNLQQFLPSNSYQTKILETLQYVHITSSWVKQEYQNGSIYLGEILDGKKHGKGLYVFGSNDFYFGDWIENSINGYGTYVFISGEVYEGQIKKGVKEGHGRCQYEDGRIYEGSWANNCKVGLGKVKFPNDVTFIGAFKANCNETEGLFLGPMNSENQPMWENKGILEHYNWQKNSIQTPTELTTEKKKKLQNCLSEFYSQRRENDGSHYEGEMVDDKKEGFGTFQNHTQRYEGEWKNDRREGYGVVHVKDTFSIAGRWKDGLMVEYACAEEEDVVF